MMFLHVMDFDGDVVTSFSKSSDSLVSVIHRRSQEDDSELVDITMLTQDAKELSPRRRILLKDENKEYREFVITRSEQENTGYTVIEASGSHFVDISSSISIPKGRYYKMTAKDMLYEVLRGTGWEVGEVDWAGEKTVDWDVENTPYDVLKQICTAFKLTPFYKVEVDDKKVTKRTVDLLEKNPLFNGKEIKKGKDLISLKRIADTAELNTALIALGPQDEKGNRLRIEVKDEENNQIYGLEQTYIWGIYEPESSDEAMTETRLRTLAKAELAKRNKINVSYEVSAADIHAQYPHEVTRFGDIVRIKDTDFSPPLYAEAEVTGIEHDLLTDERTYTFGTPKEFLESDLRKYFTEKLAMIRDMMSDNILNTNTIINEVKIEIGNTERKILKQPYPPLNPVNGQLWYDTSNDNVAVLRVYQDGEWVASTAEKAEDIGTYTKAQILYKDAMSSYELLRTQHAGILASVNPVLSNEYLVDETIRSTLTTQVNSLVTTFDSASALLASINEQTATVENVLALYNILADYRKKMQDLNITLENAKKSINERFALLQSQYTDAKVKEIFSEVAAGTGLTYDEATGTLTGAIGITEQQVTDISDKVQSNLVGKYVTTTTYTADIGGIVKDLQNQRSAIEQTDKAINLEVSDSKLNTVMKTLTEAVSSIQLLAEGITLTSGADGIASTFSVNPDMISIKSDKINLIGDVYMKNGLVRVSSLRIGGDDGDGKIEIKNSDNEVFFGLDTEQATASELSIGTLRVEKIENKDIVTQSSEDKTFYVTLYGDNENDGLTINTAFATVERALEEIPTVYNGKCTIYLRGLDGYENVEVKGYMGKGKIIFAGCTSTGAPKTNQVRNSVSFKFAGNTIDSYLKNLIIETESGTTAVIVDGSSVSASNININGQGGSESAVSVSRNSYFEWRTGETTNVTRGMACQSGSNAYLRDVNLYASDYGIVSSYASQVECSSVKIKAGTSTNAFGGSFINGSITTSSTSSTKPVAPPPTTKTVTLTSSSAGHYYKNYGNLGWNGTFMKGYPIQGVWNPYGERSGFWFFGSQFDRFVGKKIKKVRVYIGRSSVNMQGYTGSRKATLRMHTYATKPSAAPTTSNATQSKAIMLSMGESKWVDVTSVFGPMINQKAWKGFAVNTDSASQYEYMAMKPTLKVEVTYVV